MSLRAAGYKYTDDRRPGVSSSMTTTDEAEKLSELIGEIYDAALDPSLWSDVVGKAGRFVGGSAAAIFSKNAVAGNGNIYCESGTDLSYRQLYCDKYAERQPLTAGDTFADIGHLIAVADLMPYRELLETPFYRGRGQLQGPVDGVSAVPDKSLTSAALFGVFRSESDGIVDDETRQRMRLIVPHIRRAVRIGRDLDLKFAEAATLADTLDGLGAGICLVDAGGCILHANAACQVLLDAGDFLFATDGRVVASDVKVDQAFRELFAAAGGGGAAAAGTRGTALSLRARDGLHYVAHVVPLASGARRLAGIAYSAVAAVFICKVAMETPAAPDVIARTYNLTPSELRVLLAIVEIGGVPDVATALGVAESTVKTHLGRLFLKTGASRQADLVKIVAGFATPLTA